MNIRKKNRRKRGALIVDKTCWTCGHYLIGGGCWKDGHMGEEGWKSVSPNDSCNFWVEEGTKGTITDYSELTEEGMEK